MSYLQKKASIGLFALVPIMLLVLLATGSGLAAAPPSEAKVNWQQCKGETINALFITHPWQQAIEPLIPSFEKLTGIKVNVQHISEDLFHDRFTLGLSAPKPPFDLMFLAIGDQGLGAYLNGWLEPLDGYLNDPKVTDKQWYNFADLYPGYVAGLRLPSPDEGQYYGLPIAGEVYMYFYRTDLFKKYGIDPKGITTQQKWVDTVKSLNKDVNGDNRIDTYGTSIRGANVGLGDELNAVVLNHWGKEPYLGDRFVYFDKDWHPRFTDPRVMKGFEDWATLMKNSPPGVTSFDWYEATTQFAQGKAATFGPDASLFASGFQDPKTSRVAGKVGFMPLPPTENGNRTTLWSWALAIPSKSSHKKAAYLFLEWATSPFIDQEVGLKTWAAVRNSTWSSKLLQDRLPAGFAQAVGKSLSIAAPSIMYLKPSAEVLQAMVDTLHSMYQGTPTSAAMNALNQKAIDLVKAAGLYK